MDKACTRCRIRHSIWKFEQDIILPPRHHQYDSLDTAKLDEYWRFTREALTYTTLALVSTLLPSLLIRTPFNPGVHPRQRQDAHGYSTACSTILPKSLVTEGYIEDDFGVRAR